MNIVSFDPRSVGKSDPKVSCSSPPSGNETITRRQEDSIIVGDLKGMWDKKLKEQSACAALNKDTGMKYIGTSAVVQDLIYFIEQQALLKGEDPETAQINYFGTSYGTAIGQTLVAMYPQRLRRVLLDGNIYAVAHYQGWEPNGVDDFAHGIYMFSKLCFEAGAKWCPLAEGMDSIEDVQARFDAVVLALAVSPIDCKSEQPPFDHNSFMGMVSGMMYSARAQYPQLANLTVQVEAALLAEDLSAFCASPASAKLKKREDAPAEGDDGVLVISAVDMAGRYPWSTYEEFKAAAEALEATAPYGAWTYATQNG